MTNLDLIEQHASDLWRGERALKALGDLAQADGSLASGNRPRELSHLRAEDFSCLIDVVTAWFRLHIGLIDDAIQREKRGETADA